MNISKFLIKNSDGKPSTTMTAFILGFVVVNIKLLISGLTVGGYTMANFSGVDFAAAVGSLGMIYVMRRGQSKKGEKNDK